MLRRDHIFVGVCASFIRRRQVGAAFLARKEGNRHEIKKENLMEGVLAVCIYF
jgi:hypothetical protein